ncbi:dynein heavy chain domain-containing protein 1 [Leptodactylus fuscus]|uniref:dynein heavy chain domain-containing protein 1 n=1 Tax=Leptodactylus fuscus TaxID=238119 RepID=UPI003F4EEC62
MQKDNGHLDTEPALGVEVGSIDTKKVKPPASDVHHEWSKSRPLRHFLLGEWNLLRQLLRDVTHEVTDAASSCVCHRCQEIRKELSEGHVPQWWNVYSAAASITLQAWIQGLHQRLKLLFTYISRDSLLNATYNVSVFQHPSHFLHSLLQEQALEDHGELENYRLRVKVSGRLSPPPPPMGVSLVGIHLCHALWDTRLDLLQETLSPQLCSLPLVHISAVPESSDPPQSQYLCPLYIHEGPGVLLHPEKSPLLILPLPTNVSPNIWKLRSVRALSLL